MAKVEISTKKTSTPARPIVAARIAGIRSRDVFRTSEKPLAVMTPLEKMELVMEGVSKKELEQLKDITEMDYDRLAQALSVTRATLINKKGKEKFGTGLSEKIVGLADIYSYGYSVFEDEDRFNQWVMRPNKALGGQAPFDLLNNQFGREEVRNLIGRIEHGVYS
jgi:putative toxin-antitoxin system antitoxin component (TIGR02293 family)